MVYIYESHLGSMYVTEEQQDYKDSYCEHCGDSDIELFASNDIDEIRNFLKTQIDVFDSGGYPIEYCNDIYNECYAILEEQGYIE